MTSPKKVQTYNERLNRQRARSKRFRKLYPKRYATYNRNRRARLKGSPLRHSVEDIGYLFEIQGGCCEYCKQRLTKRFQVDHIIPLARNGGNSLENLQLLCPRCNGSKGARDPFEFANSIGRLF